MRRKMTDHDLSGISLLYHFPTNHVFLSGYEWTRTIDLSILSRSNQLSYTLLSPIYDLFSDTGEIRTHDHILLDRQVEWTTIRRCHIIFISSGSGSRTQYCEAYEACVIYPFHSPAISSASTWTWTKKSGLQSRCFTIWTMEAKWPLWYSLESRTVFLITSYSLFPHRMVAVLPGLEPGTKRLTVARSTNWAKGQ